MEVKYGLSEKRMKQLTSKKIKFFRRTAEYTLCDCKRNNEMLEEFKKPVKKKLRK
jgi:hypothetical protein